MKNAITIMFYKGVGRYPTTRELKEYIDLVVLPNKELHHQKLDRLMKLIQHNSDILKEYENDRR